MTNYDSLSDSLARRGYYACCQTRSPGVYLAILWNSKLKGRPPQGTGATALEALLAADAERQQIETEQGLAK